jgi:hypothetical protein
MHEFILIFQNEGEMRIPIETEYRLSEDFIKKVSWSVWEMGVSYTKAHDTVEGETVLDPFGIDSKNAAALDMQAF